MSHNPAEYYPPNYFASGYWGGEQVEGSISANLSGAGAVSASLTRARPQNSWNSGPNYGVLLPPILVDKVRIEPAYISASLAGGSEMQATGVAIDKWAQAREEDEFWLMVA
jgi:hypothetical protein